MYSLLYLFLAQFVDNYLGYFNKFENNLSNQLINTPRYKLYLGIKIIAFLI